jgi:hypothetical protein
MAPRWIHLAVLVAACVPSAGRQTRATDVPGALAPKPTVAPCPATDYAALEPSKQHPDSRTIALDRVFEREEARDAIVVVPTPLDIGVMRVARAAPPRPHERHRSMGWLELQVSWVSSTVSPEVTAPLVAWEAARKRFVEHLRGSSLLDTRLDYARSVPPPEAWGGLRCVEEAAAQAARDESQAGAVTKRAREELLEVLEGLSSPTPGDAVLLGYLLVEELPDRAIELFTKVAGDKTVDRELRARAAEQLARVKSFKPDSVVKPLELVLSLTQDPELTLETLIKLADLSEDATEAEKLRVRILSLLESHGDGWRVAQMLALLAQARLARGAFELARDDAARCARTSAKDFALDPDPWGCAPILAEALAELAAAPAGQEVPLAFLGPLAIASMDSALARHDHVQAQHVGMLLLAELPTAAEAPEVLAMLMGIVQTDQERAALAATKARSYGPDGAWAVEQRRRLAWANEPEEVERHLAALREPKRPPPVVVVPQAPIELTAELRERARMVAHACAAVLPKGRRSIEVVVSTIGTAPVASVRRAKPAAAACLRRATESRWRSVGAVETTFGVALE